jgi:hypothetical protein
MKNKVEYKRSIIMRHLFVIIIALFLSTALYAQVHVNINIGSQPPWGPVGYDYVEYYYLPDIEVYYSVPAQRYYYNERGRWINSVRLPVRFGRFDLYHSHKIIINERSPWRNHRIYRDKYYSYRGSHDQQPIRDSRDSRYFENRYHPEHDKWVQHQKHDNGLHKGWYKGNNGKGNGRGK